MGGIEILCSRLTRGPDRRLGPRAVTVRLERINGTERTNGNAMRCVVGPDSRSGEG